MISNKGYTTIDSVVRSALADNGYVTLHKYLPYLNWALEGLREWMHDGGQEVRTVMVEMNPNKTVDFPDDMIGWCKIGVKVGDRIVSFVRDSTIAIDYQDCVPEKPFSVAHEAYPYTYDFLNYYSSTGSLGVIRGYGFGHNGVGYFTPDNACRQFNFSSEVSATCIYLEYISNGFNPTSESVVNEVASKLIKEYIHYREARFKLGDAHRETQAKKIEYLQEFDQVRSRLSDLSYEGIQSITTRTTTLAPKQ